ncbi:MAG: long-chain fatty acid--CoA ligase [Acidobacteria bacterium]|nr:long-chain fatty acid--CoA ligase [Acidobacteriota bacterium]MCA1641979.1 long-chain fatty acid--CoA ligase [Acidobacteriota bacterium]
MTNTPGTTDTTARGGEAIAPAAPPRVPLSADEPTTLAEVFQRAVRVHPKPDALNFKRDGAWQPISSHELIGRARAIAAGLYALGVRRGERAAILSESSPVWTITDAGCQLAGVVDVPVYPTQAPAQVSYILNDSGARVLFVQHRAAFDRIVEALGECPALEHVVFLDGAGMEGAGRVSTLDALEARGRELLSGQPDLVDGLARAVRPQDLATIIYTSGTTGEPKGVMLTQSNLVTNMIDSSGHLDFRESDVVLSVLPLSHVFERLAMYMYVHHGMSVHFAEAIEKIGDNMREVRPTLMLCVPRLFEKILARIRERAAAKGQRAADILAWATGVAKEWARYTAAHQTVPPMLEIKHAIADRLVYSKWREGVGGRMRLFVSGGAALPEEIAYAFLGAGLPIVQGYGLTETSPVIAAGNLEDNRVGTVGKPIRNVEVRIAPDGEIETRGPNVMRGYFNKPEETRAVFTPDGWFKTGDVGELDAEGNLRITDRKKELFKTSGGKYLAPQVIEQCVKRSRFVNQVVLVGNGRKFPAALIVPNWTELRAYAEFKGIDARAPEELCRDERVLDLMRRQVDSQCAELSRYERVKRIALLPCELTVEGGEMTPTLKVKRRVVDQKYRDVIERLYAEAETP